MDPRQTLAAAACGGGGGTAGGSNKGTIGNRQHYPASGGEARSTDVITSMAITSVTP